jgi:hypothetical protein
LSYFNLFLVIFELFQLIFELSSVRLPRLPNFESPVTSNLAIFLDNSVIHSVIPRFSLGSHSVLRRGSRGPLVAMAMVVVADAVEGRSLAVFEGEGAGTRAVVSADDEGVVNNAPLVFRDARASRADLRGTDVAYKPYVKEFTTFCHGHGWSHAVNAEKMLEYITFLTLRKKKIRTKRKTIECDDEEEDGGGGAGGTAGGGALFEDGADQVEPATVKLAIAAIKDLWVAQEHEHAEYKGVLYARGSADPRTKTVTAKHRTYADETSARRQAAFRDPTIGTVADNGGAILDLASIGRMLRGRNTEVGDRTLFDALAVIMLLLVLLI